MEFKFRDSILEKYDVITRPGPREAMDKFGFYLDRSETRYKDGEVYYRVIKPRGKKGGWATGYDSPIDDHLDDPISSIKYREERWF